MSHNSKGLNTVLTKEYLMEEHYDKKRSIRDIAREHGCSHSNVNKYLKKYNLKNKTTLKGNEYGRIYDINHDYFETIDSDKKAYWFGFIYADGYISTYKKSGQNLRILLSKKDEVHVKALRDELGSMKIGNYTQKGTGHKSSYFSVHSEKMVSDLIRLNATFPKNKRTGLPNISNEYFYSFLLGLFDGDGSIVISNNIPTISMLGHLELVEWIKEKLETDGFVFNGVNIHKLQGVYRIAFSSQRNISLFYKKTYVDNNTPYLKRKRDIFDNYLSSMKI